MFLLLTSNTQTRVHFLTQKDLYCYEKSKESCVLIHYKSTLKKYKGAKHMKKSLHMFIGCVMQYPFLI